MGDKFGFALSEASTWQGIVLFISGVMGWNLSNEESSTIVSLGVACAGLARIITRRRSSE